MIEPDETESGDPTFIELEGDGPFELEIVTDVELAVGDQVSFLELTTIDGKIVLVPFGHEVISALHQLTGQALADMRPGVKDTVQ